jgi:hypothetical protein
MQNVKIALNAIYNIHKLLFEDFFLQEFPKYIIIENKRLFSSVNSMLIESIGLIGSFIGENSDFEKDIEKIRKRIEIFKNEMNITKKLNPIEFEEFSCDINSIKSITSKEKWQIEKADACLKNVLGILEKISSALHKRCSSIHMEYILELDKYILSLRDAFNILTKIWQMEKRIEREEITLGDLFQELQKKGVDSNHPVFNTDGKQQREILEAIASLEYQIELDLKRYS